VGAVERGPRGLRKACGTVRYDQHSLGRVEWEGSSRPQESGLIDVVPQEYRLTGADQLPRGSAAPGGRNARDKIGRMKPFRILARTHG
jgi:hypothetical protein